METAGKAMKSDGYHKVIVGRVVRFERGAIGSYGKIQEFFTTKIFEFKLPNSLNYSDDEKNLVSSISGDGIIMVLNKKNFVQIVRTTI